LVAVSLITTPFTQHLWTWDHFLHGGQDFESSTLLILSSLCLALVLVRCCKQGVDEMLACGRISFIAPLKRHVVGSRPSGLFFAAGEERASSPILSIYNLPLQI
jgi:hypothetical protein